MRLGSLPEEWGDEDRCVEDEELTLLVCGSVKSEEFMMVCSHSRDIRATSGIVYSILLDFQIPEFLGGNF
jgi:hypothetical protein